MEAINALMEWLTGFLSKVLEGAWAWLNYTMIKIIDAALSLWPSTPDGLKLSTLIANMQAAAPGAPWFLVADLIRSAAVVLGVVLTWKVLKMVRG